MSKRRSNAFTVECRECGRDWPWYIAVGDPSVGVSAAVSPEYGDTTCSCGEPTPTEAHAWEAIREMEEERAERQAEAMAEARMERWRR
jgi:hypothetical protein